MNEKPWYPTHHFEYLEKSPAWNPKEHNLHCHLVALFLNFRERRKGSVHEEGIKMLAIPAWAHDLSLVMGERAANILAKHKEVSNNNTHLHLC